MNRLLSSVLGIALLSSVAVSANIINRTGTTARRVSPTALIIDLNTSQFPLPDYFDSFSTAELQSRWRRYRPAYRFRISR